MRPILILQNVRISTGFPTEFFTILDSSLNGSYHHVRALKDGLTLIDATLKAVVDEVSLCANLTLIRLCLIFILPYVSLLHQPSAPSVHFNFSCGLYSVSEWKHPHSCQPSPQ